MVELEFINSFVVITFTAQVVIMHNEDSHSFKDPGGPESPEFRKGRSQFALRVLSIYLKAKHPHSAVHSGHAVYSGLLHEYSDKNFCSLAALAPLE